MLALVILPKPSVTKTSLHFYVLLKNLSVVVLIKIKNVGNFILTI